MAPDDPFHVKLCVTCQRSVKFKGWEKKKRSPKACEIPVADVQILDPEPTDRTVDVVPMEQPFMTNKSIQADKEVAVM